MKKFLFALFLCIVTAPVFGGCGAGGGSMLKTIPSGENTGNNQRFIKTDIYSDSFPKYLKCGADNDTDNNYCTDNTTTIDNDYNVYRCSNNKWIKLDSINLCPNNADYYRSSGLKHNYPDARMAGSRNVLFYKKDPTQDLTFYCHSPISDYIKTEEDCEKNGGEFTRNNFVCTYFRVICDGSSANCYMTTSPQPYLVESCNEIADKLTDKRPIVIDTTKIAQSCDKQIQSTIAKLCPTTGAGAQTVGKYLVVTCNADTYIKNQGTQYDKITDINLSYAEKKCRGSGGDFKDGNCTCSNSQTKPENGECLCTTGNTKYLVGNNCNEGTACISTGGDPKNDSECDCPEHMHAVKLHTKSDIKVCECDNGYHYRDPMRRWEGCVKINDTVTISGTVMDDNGETIPYATVKVSNSSNGTITDDTGRFSLQNVPNTEYVTFSSIGYKPTTWAATDLQDATVRMYTNTETLNEVTVTASPLIPEQSEQITMPGTPDKACVYSGGTYQNNQCICDSNEYLELYKPEKAKNYTICTCMRGYKRKNAEMDTNGNTTWYPEKDPCIPANDYEIQIVPDKIGMQRDAEDAYRNEYDNAQSWANKGTTALSTLMTGEGAMMAARAIAERKADDDAEEKMSEYVSTMKCEYGGGQLVNLGDTETLPGGNELTNYYAEYKQLADKLKATKAALNLRPGIEAEVLYDRAETGLYQYQNAERQSGGFTSLSRALMNPEGADATAWNAQRAETNQNLLVGGALATVGLAGSYVANRAINKDHVKKYKELEEKFMEITTKLEREYPEIFTAPTPKQPIHEESVGTLDPVIPSIEPLPANELNAIDLSNLTDKAFNRSEIDLTYEGTNALTTEAKYLDDQLKEHPNMNITITATGHADPDGISAKTATALTNRYKEIFNVNSLPNKYKNKKIGKNDDLALARAEVALKFLTEQLSDNTKKRVSTIAQTRGDRDCPKGTPKEKYDTCRYVGFEVQINITGAQ